LELTVNEARFAARNEGDCSRDSRTEKGSQPVIQVVQACLVSESSRSHRRPDLTSSRRPAWPAHQPRLTAAPTGLGVSEAPAAGLAEVLVVTDQGFQVEAGSREEVGIRDDPTWGDSRSGTDGPV